MLTGTLVAEGPSDRRLIPILAWAVRANGRGSISIELAQFFGRRPTTLSERIAKAVELFPCDVLFVHRDSDNAAPEDRLAEITRGIDAAGVVPSWIAVVPVRAQETWLLFSEAAIRRAAGYPKGTESLGLPSRNRLESVSDPKTVLRDALRKASGLTGRRLKNFDDNQAAYLLAEQLDDFSALRALDAFSAFESRLKAALPAVADDAH